MHTNGTPRTLTQLLVDGYQVRPGEFIGQGWEVARSRWVIFSVYLVLLLLIGIALSLAPFPVNSIVCVTLASPLNTGWFILAYYAYLRNQSVRPLDLLRICVRFFDFLMTDLSFVLFCLFLSVILLIISALALVTCTSIALLILAAMQGVDINDIDIQTNYLDLIVAGILMGLFILNGLITMAYLGTVLMFSKLFIIDQNVNFWLAMVCSWRLVKQNFWSWFWFLLLLILTNLGGALLCGLGLGVTIPLTFCSITMAYLDVMNRAT